MPFVLQSNYTIFVIPSFNMFNTCVEIDLIIEEKWFLYNKK